MKGLIHRIENSDQSIFEYFISFLSIITLRIVIECFSDKTPLHLEIIFHYYLAYIVLALNIVLLFYFVLNEKLDKIIKIVLFGFSFILLGPLFDLLFSGWEGSNISYLLPGIHENILLRYFTFFGEFNKIGVTLGLRIEIGLILIITFFYFKLKIHKLIKSFLFTIILYTIIYIYFCLPFLLKFLVERIGFNYEYNDQLMISTALLLLTFFIILFFWIKNSNLFMTLVRNIRIYGVLHFYLMFLLGIVLFPVKPLEVFIYPKDLFFLFVSLLAIFFTYMVSFINNTNDFDMDNINKELNPNVSSKLNTFQSNRLVILFFVLMSIYSISVDFRLFFIFICFLGNDHIYFQTPFLLKRVPFFSKILFSFNSVLLVIAGFIFAGGDFLEFPQNIFLYFVVLLVFPIQFTDIKNYSIDKENGINTLPVLLGLRFSKVVIGLFFMGSFFLMPVFLGIKELLPFATGLGLIEFFFLNKKKYQEVWVFIFYLLGVIALTGYLIYLKNLNIEVLLDNLFDL